MENVTFPEAGDPAAGQSPRGALASLARGALVAALLLGALAGAVALRIQLDRSLPFLHPHPPGQWIRPPDELFLGVRRGIEIAQLRTEVEPRDAALRLDVWSPGEIRVVLDQDVLPAAALPQRAGEPISFELPPGRAVSLLTVVVARELGPALVAARSQPAGIATGTHWQGRFLPGARWGPVVVADGTRGHPLALDFPAAGDSVAGVAPLLLAVLLVATVLARWGLRQPRRLVSVVRWSALAAWMVLAVNNVSSLPLHLGFDVDGHLAFIRHLAHGGGLPRPGDGWQMFQSPLYYLLSAGLVAPLEPWLPPDVLLRVLRVIPLLAGLAMVELTFRACRLGFPERHELQAAGTLIGGFLPINLYMSQYVGNEPLAGAFSAGCLVATLAVLRQPRRAATWRWPVTVGLLLGLALLTKVSALLLAPVIAIGLVWAGCRAQRTGRGLAAAAIAAVVALLASGWFYARNWLLTGAPFIGGWDAARGIAWWQDPGFRTWDQLLSFGAALDRPIFAGTHGLWDALWSTLWLDGYLSSRTSVATAPPWNFAFVSASALLSLIPALLLAIGSGLALDPRGWRTRPALPLAAVALLIFLAALVWLWMEVPIYSTAKATYTLGLLPAYALLVATGAGAVARGPWGRAAVIGMLSAWAFNAYAGFFVLS